MAGLTQAELAAQAGIGLSAVQAVEHGHGRVSSLTAILKTLGLELRGRQLCDIAASCCNRYSAAGRAKCQAFRGRLGISQEELAFRSGLHRTYVSGVECGIRNPTAVIIDRLAKALEVEAASLLQAKPKTK